jgi:hypothetical protein
MGGGICMKYIKVVIEIMFEAPGDMKIVVYPEEKVEYLKINGQEYTVLPEWVKHNDDNDDEQIWINASEEFDEFIEEPGKLDALIKAISEEEFREAMPQE